MLDAGSEGRSGKYGGLKAAQYCVGWGCSERDIKYRSRGGERREKETKAEETTGGEKERKCNGGLKAVESYCDEKKEMTENLE